MRRGLVGLALLALASLFLPHKASAQGLPLTVTVCGTLPAGYVYTPAQQTYPETMDITGKLCSGAGPSGVLSTVTGAGYATTPVGSTVTTHAVFQSALASNVNRRGCLLVNTSLDTEYAYFGPTGSATTAASIPLVPGAAVNCASGVIVATDNIALTSKTTDGATYLIDSQ